MDTRHEHKDSWHGNLEMFAIGGRMNEAAEQFSRVCNAPDRGHFSVRQTFMTPTCSL